MDFGIDGKVAVVGGGSRGCGLGVSKALAAEGVHVFLTGRRERQVEEAVAQIQAAGGVAAGMAADMADPAMAEAIVAEATARLGAPTILVVNPKPVSLSRGFDQMTDDDFREAADIYVVSMVALVRAMLPAMKAAQWGRIVCLGSIGMKVLHLDDPMYAQNTRVAAAAIVKTMAHEFGPFGITANTIATGPFMTGLTQDYIEGGGLAEDKMLAMTASGRWGTPEEMGAVVAFLCSRQASFVTGETIRVDSGYTHSLF